MSRLEVHTHYFTSGSRAYKSWLSTLTHSHEGGSEPHQHPNTGPGSYTIDKDEWFATTGLRGGGRKKFTKKPSGEQLPIRELEDWQKSFKVIIYGPYEGQDGEGPGIALPMRLILGLRMSVSGVSDESGMAGAR